ncbi:hypothetical protein MKW98_014865 [Papaver atlanticum]|uniref:Uncharacterized protein n=1 Tax=Papaver atlanticum TaxID=357466 RepID=A0AAD4XEN6_9MAGN|nr:hypothetical protein MKW98_014865 [Papaver atlanticum]
MRTAILLEAAMTPLQQQHSALQIHSPWHSPVPYLFGGLAAMLGLIAFALLILACSYWKLSGNLDNREDQNGDQERDLENGDEKSSNQAMKIPVVYEEKIVVIMAGDEKPRYLATPISSKTSSFAGQNDNSKNIKANESKEEDGDEKLQVKVDEESKEESSTHHQNSEENSES